MVKTRSVQVEFSPARIRKLARQKLKFSKEMNLGGIHRRTLLRNLVKIAYDIENSAKDKSLSEKASLNWFLKMVGATNKKSSNGCLSTTSPAMRCLTFDAINETANNETSDVGVSGVAEVVIDDEQLKPAEEQEIEPLQNPEDETSICIDEL